MHMSCLDIWIDVKTATRQSRPYKSTLASGDKLEVVKVHSMVVLVKDWVFHYTNMYE